MLPHDALPRPGIPGIRIDPEGSERARREPGVELGGETCSS
jgi:hypothetical protein